MNSKRKQMKKEIEKELCAQKHLRDAEDRVIVNMRVTDDTDFLSPFSKNETPIIHADVAEFLETSTHSVPPSDELTLRIHANCIDEQEKTVYDKAIRQYYKEKYLANKNELRRNMILTLIFGLLGVFILAFSVFIDYTVGSVIWAEVVDIVAWVLLWEAVDISIFENQSLRLKEKRYLSFVDMKIEYYSDAEND